MLAFALAFLAGLLTSLSPCVLPVLPLVVGGALTRNRLGPVALCAGLGLAFAVLGTAAALATQAFGFDAALVRTAGAVVLLALGGVLLVPRAQETFSRALSPFASRAGRFSDSTPDGGLAGQFIVGLGLGAVWSPCSGPTLGAAVGLAAQAGTAGQGFLTMLVFSLGASLPLLGIAYGFRSLYLAHKGRLIALSMRAKPVFGALLLVVGAGILTGWDKRLETAVLSWLPESWVDLTSQF